MADQPEDSGAPAPAPDAEPAAAAAAPAAGGDGAGAGGGDDGGASDPSPFYDLKVELINLINTERQSAG